MVPTLVTRQMACVVVSVVLAATLLASARSSASTSPGSSTVPASLGRQLYRQYCGKCHALAVALSAGFGSQNGLGTNGGPSFNNLRVPVAMSIVAVTEPTGGHELVSRKIKAKQLAEVATYIATATRDHPILATSTDG